MWVKLLTVRQIEVNGRMKTYHPGSWVDVGKQEAARWIAQGIAETPHLDQVFALTGCGVVIPPEGHQDVALSRFADLIIERAAPSVAFLKTLLHDGHLPLRSELIPVGFKLIQTWEVALPILSYETLACHVGTDEERAITQTVIRDLRVPLYHTGLIFVRRCRNGKEVVKQWVDECKRGESKELAWLRALYKVKPAVCALPISWHGKGER